jgi:hypothetical protein
LYPSYKTPVVVIEWFVQFYCSTLIPSIEQFVEVLLPSVLANIFEKFNFEAKATN